MTDLMPRRAAGMEGWREGASGTLAAKDGDVIPLGALGGWVEGGARDLAISLKEACAMSQTFDWGGAEGGCCWENGK